MPPRQQQNFVMPVFQNKQENCHKLSNLQISGYSLGMRSNSNAYSVSWKLEPSKLYLWSIYFISELFYALILQSTFFTSNKQVICTMLKNSVHQSFIQWVVNLWRHYDQLSSIKYDGLRLLIALSNININRRSLHLFCFVIILRSDLFLLCCGSTAIAWIKSVN